MLAERGIDPIAHPREPRRARDHALPRRPRRRGRSPPLRRRARHHATRHRPRLRRPGLARRRAHGRPARRAGPARPGSRASSRSATPSSTSRTGCPASTSSSSSRRPWPGASGCARTSSIRHGSSRRPWPPAGTSSSRAPRARCSTSTTAPIPYVTSSNPVAGGACTGGGVGPAPGRAGHRHPQGLLDARGLRPVPDGAGRRHRPLPAREGPRVRHDDRPAAPLRLVRRRAAALRGGGQQREQPHAQQARHPERAAGAARRRRLPGGRRRACAGRSRSRSSSAPSPSTRCCPAGRRTSRARAAWPTCPPPRRATSRPSRTLAGVPGEHRQRRAGADPDDRRVAARSPGRAPPGRLPARDRRATRCPEMAALWSERRAASSTCCSVELAVLRALAERGTVPADAVDAIEARARVDVERDRRARADDRPRRRRLRDPGRRVGRGGGPLPPLRPDQQRRRGHRPGPPVPRSRRPHRSRASTRVIAAVVAPRPRARRHAHDGAHPRRPCRADHASA